MEAEITAPVDLRLPDGHLNPEAVGWTRHPLHRANLRGWGRAKRWEYWCVQAPDWALSVTISHIDYLALHQVWFVDFTTGEQIDTGAIVPLARGPVLPDRSGGGPARARTKKLAIDLIPNTQGVRLVARTDRVDADVQILRPAGHESMDRPEAPLDLVMARKIGVPGQEEVAAGRWSTATTRTSSSTRGSWLPRG